MKPNYKLPKIITPNNLKTAFLIFNFSLLMIIFSSCEKNPLHECTKRAGDIDSLEIELENFKTIEIYNKLRVVIKQDSINKIVVSGGENLIENFYAEVSDSTLKIGETNGCNFTRSYDNEIVATIHTSELKEVFVYGPSILQSAERLDIDRLLIRVYGRVGNVDLDVNCDHFFMEFWQATGDANISGKTHFFHVLNHGQAYVRAYELEADYVEVEHRSTGNVETKANKKISAILVDIGNVIYEGNPEINIIEQKSTGTIIPKN